MPNDCNHMNRPQRRRAGLVAVLVLAAAFAASAQDDLDALQLQAAPAAAAAAAESNLHAYVELAAGRVERRGGLSSQDGRRASLDLRYAAPLGAGWRFGLSDRLDDVHPVATGMRATTNSLREAWLGWRDAAGTWSADLGRINWRRGPAYGYNPTDYFRSGGLRAVTTLDPVTLRETRMGTGMLRVANLWAGGGATLALAPKLADGPSQGASAVDLGATNMNDRALIGVNQRLSPSVSAEGSLLLQRGTSATFGASLTALLTDSIVAYGEWSSGKSRRIDDIVLATGAPARRVQQAAVGLTWTLPTALALTLEAEYNGAGVDRAGWNAVLAGGPAAYQAYQAQIQPGQDIGSRRAWLLYATQKGLGLKQLDLTAFVRVNAVDHSRLAWAELRYHWPRFDAALQWNLASGGGSTEFGVMPYRQIVQLVGVAYF